MLPIPPADPGVRQPWSDPARANKRRFEFTGTPSVNINPVIPDSPLAFLKTFITDELVDNIVLFTNRYADIMKNTPEIQARMEEKSRSLFTLWKDTNRDEMWIYLCICFMMGIVKKPDIHSYWSQQHVLSTPYFSQLMRRDRFKQIRKMIHFSDPAAEAEDDDLKKLRFFFDYLLDKFRTNYTPEENLECNLF